MIAFLLSTVAMLVPYMCYTYARVHHPQGAVQARNPPGYLLESNAVGPPRAWGSRSKNTNATRKPASAVPAGAHAFGMETSRTPRS